MSNIYNNNDFYEELELNYQEILKFMKDSGYLINSIPLPLRSNISEGEAYSIAYPIQGLLKYHGMTDSINRIAYFPSISLNNDTVITVTYLKFDKSFNDDKFYLNGKEVKNREYERIQFLLDKIRDYSQIKTKALVVSGNFTLSNDNNQFSIEKGKGLGTSASGGAAIVTAALDIIYKDKPEIRNNKELQSYLARFLAGSASRSVVGGMGIWLSHPRLEPSKNIAIRLDGNKNKEFINNIRIISCSIESKIKTEDLHEISTKSPFFKNWALSRKESIIEFINALNSSNLDKIGKLTEFDTLCLHSISMTGDIQNSHVLWEPDTIKIIRVIEEVRTEGVQAYYSIDTGPSVVIICSQSNVPIIINKLYSKGITSNISIGKIGGESQIIEKGSKYAQVLADHTDKSNIPIRL